MRHWPRSEASAFQAEYRAGALPACRSNLRHCSTKAVHGFGKAETRERYPPMAPICMRNLWLISVIGVLVGCSPKVSPPPQVNEVVVTDVRGQKYRFVSPEIANADGTKTVELWEKIEPRDTNRWYTPTLGSKMDTNNPPIFNSLMR